MNTNVYLVRHAHSDYTPDEVNRPLSEKGLKDAQRVARLLLPENITHVLSSPFRRAVQTVEGIAAACRLPVETDPGFRERRLAEGMVPHFEEAVRKAWEDFSFAFPGGESGRDAQARGTVALGQVLARYGGGNIAIGTHGNILALILNGFDAQYDYAFWRRLAMPDIYRLTFQDGQPVQITPFWQA